MARGPRSRASRAERRMQKERAASALQRGLPVPTPLPKRAPAYPTPSSRPNASSAGRAGTAGARQPNSGMPLAVKLLGLGLGLLGLVYGLTVFRDYKPLREPAATRATVTGGSVK